MRAVRSGAIPATGKELDAEAAHIFDFRNGKVYRFQQYLDTWQSAEVTGRSAPGDRPQRRPGWRSSFGGATTLPDGTSPPKPAAGTPTSPATLESSPASKATSDSAHDNAHDSNPESRSIENGFRNVANDRLRLLLSCDVTWQDPPTARLRGQPRSNA